MLDDGLADLFRGEVWDTGRHFFEVSEHKLERDSGLIRGLEQLLNS